MPEYPDLSDSDAIRRFAAEHPAEGLSNIELAEEIERWRVLLDRAEMEEKRRSESPRAEAERQILRWGGVGIAALGIPAAFLAWPIGLSIAVAGAAVTCYGEIRGWREREKGRGREMQERLAKERREALIAESNRRWRELGEGG